MAPRKKVLIVDNSKPIKCIRADEASISLSELFNKELINIIDSRINFNQTSLIEKDIKNIINKLIPDLDKMISDRVKKHIQFLGENLIKLSKGE